MFDKIKFHKSTNKILIKEYNLLKDIKYIQKSKISYKRTNNYLKQFYFTDIKTNKRFLLEKEIEKDYNNYKNLTILKTMELERIRTEKGLIPLFITLTLPSKYHPFKKVNNTYINNKNFEFIEIEERISKGYKEINKIYREFYLNVKNTKKNKDILYMKIIEPHKSLIPHLHRVIFIKQETKENIKKQFFNVCNKYKLKKVKIEELEKGTSYVIKYITKNFNEKELQQLDGWKKLHKIRLFTMSNLPLNNDIFKKLYYSNKELNLKMIDKIKNNKTKYKNLYQFYSENTTIKKVYLTEQKKLIKIDIKNNKKKNKFKFTKIIEIKDDIKTIKKIKPLNKDNLTTLNNLRDIYYKNKYKEFKTFYIINKKEEFNRFFNEKLFNIDLFFEVMDFKKIKTYIVKDFQLLDKKKKIKLLEKKQFLKHYIKN